MWRNPNLQFNTPQPQSFLRTVQAFLVWAGGGRASLLITSCLMPHRLDAEGTIAGTSCRSAWVFSQEWVSCPEQGKVLVPRATSGLGRNQPLTCGLRGHGELPTWLIPPQALPYSRMGEARAPWVVREWCPWAQAGKIWRKLGDRVTFFQRGGPGLPAHLAQPPVRTPLQHPHCPTTGTGILPLGR